MRFFIILILFCGVYSASAQEDNLFFWEAETAFDYKVADDWRFNTSLGKRSRWYEAAETGQTEVQLAFLEINQFATYQLNPDIKLSFGYKYRWEEPNDETGLYEHRLTQQASYRHSSGAFRLSSRVRLEQRIKTNEFAQRYRYRIAGDFPLSGENINTGEFYLAITNEVMVELPNKEPNIWENRASGAIGFVLNENLKLQTTITHRWEDIGQNNVERLFIATGAYFSLD